LALRVRLISALVCRVKASASQTLAAHDLVGAWRKNELNLAGIKTRQLGTVKGQFFGLAASGNYPNEAKTIYTFCHV